MAKLQILSDAAKYDNSCSSSGSKRESSKGGMGSGHLTGICHTWSADGRCVSLLKILLTNICIYNCSYCINRITNDIPRAVFTPEEIAELTINFYKRNYIEGLFLSSAIIKNEDYTLEIMVKAVEILRKVYRFGGYVHLKIIPGASPELIRRASVLSDRVSSNIELPSEKSLKILAPEKNKANILGSFKQVKNFKEEKRLPVSMSTQMIIGASPESDFDILKLSTSLYDHSYLKRVYYSAYIPVNIDKNLPAVTSQPPMLREHRLYQADWLLRFYNFRYDEILSDGENLSEYFDPKMKWALKNLNLFPVDILTADYDTIIKIPGIGVTSAKKIIKARKFGRIEFEHLQKMGISLKRAGYFLCIGGIMLQKFSYEKFEDRLFASEKVRQSKVFEFMAE